MVRLKRKPCYWELEGLIIRRATTNKVNFVDLGFPRCSTSFESFSHLLRTSNGLLFRRQPQIFKFLFRTNTDL